MLADFMFWERTSLKVGSRERKNMATLKVILKNGFFANTTGCQYVYEKTPTHVVANKWDCRIKEDGSVECNTNKLYSDGEYNLRYIIQKNGFAKLTLKAPGKRVETLKKGFVIPKGTTLSDGVIGLSGGPVYKRYAYFRDGSFQKFLSALGISAVKHEDPNQVYRVRSARYGGGECSSYLLTDGNTEIEDTNWGRTEKWQSGPGYTCASEEVKYTRVSNATWSIHDQDQHEGDRCNCFRILYTLEKDPTRIPGLLELQKKEEKISKLRKLGGFLSFKELDCALNEILPNLENKSTDQHLFMAQQPFKLDHLFGDERFWRNTRMFTNSRVPIEAQFPAKKEAEKAFELLKEVVFKDNEDFERVLKEHGFEAEVTRFYPLVHRDNNNPYRLRIDIWASATGSADGPHNTYNSCYRVKL